MPLRNLELRETEHDIEEIARAFGVEGQLIRGGEFGNGHINTTIAATFLLRDATEETYIFQCINTYVFKDADRLMSNVQRVIDHLKDKIDADGLPDTERRRLRLLRTPHNGVLWRDAEDRPWRGYDYIAGTTSFDTVTTAEQAYQAAHAFGRFTRLLADLPSDELVETIPNFHHTPTRFATLKAAIERDAAGRAAGCREEIGFALEREGICSLLLDLNAKGEIPSRITHNDTKLGNVLLCNRSGEGLCVVDLDTVMPGLALYDFGDLVRSCVCPAKEDETDLSKVVVRPAFFQALARGYIDGVGDTLTEAERAHLAFAGRLITFELATRFLADHLDGDKYFPVHRENHNLERARNQFALVKALEDQEAELQAQVDEIFAQVG